MTTPATPGAGGVDPHHAGAAAPAGTPAPAGTSAPAGISAPAGVSVRDLRVRVADMTLVESMDFAVAPGEMLAIIGESGSGKSMTARAITGLLPRGVAATGQVSIDGFRYDLAEEPERAWRQVRGHRAVLLLQDPFTSLSPVLRCGDQIAATIEARLAHDGIRGDQRQIRAEVARRLDEVHLRAQVARQYPSELSGGMRQRVAIAAALAAEPRLFIADEPTTALDASTQGEVLDLLRELQLAHHMCMILISHDLGIVSGRADSLLVMRHGAIVERGDTATVLTQPSHEYTRMLIDANPTVFDPIPPLAGAPEPLLVAQNLRKSFGPHTALDDVTISVSAGEVLAIVGESGSGKSTCARCIAGLERPDDGEITLGGRTLPSGRRGRRPQEIQVVFQDPYSTLNPAYTIGRTLTEALRAGGGPARTTVAELLRLVELDPELARRRPAQLSGGQRQRVAIARALAPNPQVLICDESVSALDVSVQAQILDLLRRLRDELDLAMVFITHDLGVVASIANRIVVLRDGVIVEQGATEQVLRHPSDPYTRMLVAAAERDSVTRGAATDRQEQL